MTGHLRAPAKNIYYKAGNFGVSLILALLAVGFDLNSNEAPGYLGKTYSELRATVGEIR